MTNFIWRRIPVVSVEDAATRICGPYRIETTWGVETGYSRKWVLQVDGDRHGVYDTRKLAKAAAVAHAAPLALRGVVRETFDKVRASVVAADVPAMRSVRDLLADELAFLNREIGKKIFVNKDPNK